MNDNDITSMDDQRRQDFLDMPREEQLLAILNMQTYARGKLADMEKRIMELEQDLIEYRKKREKAEKDNGQTERIIKGVVDKLKGKR